MKKECIYIAGPMCFYTGGFARWDSMKYRAQVKGYDVAMPNDNHLEADPEDLQ